MSEAHPPIHAPEGVSYWNEDLQEYVLDPTPEMGVWIRPEEKPEAPGKITD